MLLLIHATTDSVNYFKHTIIITVVTETVSLVRSNRRDWVKERVFSSVVFSIAS